MKKQYGLGVLMLGVLMSPVFASVANCKVDTSKQEIVNLFSRWNDALKTGDSHTVTQEYAPHAVLLPTVSNQARRNHQQIKHYFDQFLVKQPQGELVQCNVRKYDHLAVNSGIYRFYLMEKGLKKEVLARYTYVYEKFGNDWKIIEHHSSVLPEGGKVVLD
jgi:uncharacterized protein (TIGR02246 family)